MFKPTIAIWYAHSRHLARAARTAETSTAWGMARLRRVIWRSPRQSPSIGGVRLAN
jgi:hypothetical protein